MLTFTFDMSPLVWLLTALAAIAAVAAVTLGFRPMLRLRRRAFSETTSYPAPPVSVIALSSKDIDPEHFIAQVTTQDYPDYEVIIVHESTSQAHEAFAERYQWQPEPLPQSEGDDDNPPAPRGCRAVRFCFYPPGAHALSQKKLALAIGIKSAETDFVVTTSTTCDINSPRWLAAMMRNFSGDTDIVLGYARRDYDQLPKRSRSLSRFENIMTAAQWISAAQEGSPYRGDGYNLAYRRDLFFSSKGFADTNDLVNGEDDIFIAANATADNTRMEFSDEATVVPRHGEETPRMFSDAREQYRFTSAWLPRAPFLKQGIASAAQWILWCSAIAAAAVALPNLAATAISLLILIAVYLVQAFIYKKGAATLGDDRSWLLAPIFLLIRPIDNFVFDMRRRAHRYTNYTVRRQ